MKVTIGRVNKSGVIRVRMEPGPFEGAEMTCFNAPHLDKMSLPPDSDSDPSMSRR